MSIHYRQQGSAIIIFGNTYAYREQIKALGGRFNGSEKTWRIPLSPHTLQEIHTLCDSAGGGALGDIGVTAVSASQVSSSNTAKTRDFGLGPSDSALITEEALPTPSSALDPPELNLAAPSLDKPAAPGLTIRELMDSISAAVAQAFPRTVWVTGEVQNLAQRASGVFFDLAEARTGGHANSTVTVRSIIWGATVQQLTQRHGATALLGVLQDGMQLRCLVQVQLYKDRGSVTLLISDIDPAYTKGALALAREELLKELRAKGLDAANKRLRLTPLPFRVGLISAAGSRAASDFLDQLQSLKFPGEVLFCPCAMQGEGVPKQVTIALKRLLAADVDLIVLTRGGGSAADLRWFDAAEIAYAIAASPVPVLAAIGHHDDMCVAEEICFLRQKTPTAAADFIISVFTAARTQVDSLAGTLATSLGQRIEEFALHAATLAERLAGAAAGAVAVRLALLTQRSNALSQTATGRIHTLEGKISTHGAQLTLSAERAISALTSRLSTFEIHLTRVDPRPWIKQGWTQLSGKRGPVREVKDATVGELLKVRLIGGWLDVIVERKHAQADKGT